MKFVLLFILLSLLSCKTTSPRPSISSKSQYLLQIVKTHLSQCRYPQALVDMKKALSYDPKSPIINHSMGVVYFFMKQYGLAEKYFKTAIRLKSTYTEAQVSFVHILMKKKQWKEALVYLKAVEKDLTYTGHAKAYSLIGQIYYFQKKYDLAKKYLFSALNLNQNHCASFIYLGRMYYDQKQYEQALKPFNQSRQCEDAVRSFKRPCEQDNIDHYYFQAVSQLRTGSIQLGLKTLNLFIFNVQRWIMTI